MKSPIWISNQLNWSPKSNSFEQFAVERIIQRCDSNESISNRHRSSNGYTQLKELLKIVAISFDRGRTIRTLKVLIDEARSPFIKQSICDDLVIGKYFNDLKEYIKSYNHDKLYLASNLPNLTELTNLQFKLKIFEKQLDKQYYTCLKEEFNLLDFSDPIKFDRAADNLSALIDLLIPYLIFHGYSISTVAGLLASWINNQYYVTLSKILNVFKFEEKPFSFYIIFGKKNKEYKDILALITNYTQSEIKECVALDLGSNFCERLALKGSETLICYDTLTIDPHNHIRFCYDDLLKKMVITKERQSLAVFNDLIKNSFWSYSNSIHSVKPISLDGDPINVSARELTLRTTLIKVAPIEEFDFTENCPLPVTGISQLDNAIYYYNLALGSKSIENSLSLLWTSLETVLPYRVASSDIECIQHFVSSSLCVGAVSRDISGLAARFIVHREGTDRLSVLGTDAFKSRYSVEGIRQWFSWITNEKLAKQSFLTVKETSELLAYEYSKLGSRYSQGTSKDLLERMKASEMSMKYQIQRIYIHRNQIVHAGDLINEYTNLWTHLEWYVGKLLAYYIITVYFHNKYKSLEEATLSLDSDKEYLFSYLEKNEDKKILELPSRLQTIILGQNWQSF